MLIKKKLKSHQKQEKIDKLADLIVGLNRDKIRRGSLSWGISEFSGDLLIARKSNGNTVFKDFLSKVKGDGLSRSGLVQLIRKLKERKIETDSRIEVFEKAWRTNAANKGELKKEQSANFRPRKDFVNSIRKTLSEEQISLDGALRELSGQLLEAMQI